MRGTSLVAIFKKKCRVFNSLIVTHAFHFAFVPCYVRFQKVKCFFFKEESFPRHSVVIHVLSFSISKYNRASESFVHQVQE